METKQAIRDRIFRLRRQVSLEETQKISQEIASRLTQLPTWQDAQRILCYVDFGKEAGTRSLIRQAWEEGKQVAVPRVEGKEMSFYQIKDFTHMKKSAFGIDEPADSPKVNWEEGLMVMPGVAFDRTCHRIGYGGGYYDRYLASHPGILRVALAFSWQVLDQIPWEALDIRPQLIITEKEYYVCQS